MKKYKLGDIAILNASIIDKKKNIEIEYLDTSSILEGHILDTQKIYLSEAPSRAQRKVKNKTIIYSLVRPNQNHYGILYNTPDNFIVSTGFATIDLKEEFKETIDADFLFLLLTQKQITHHLHRIAENSASAYPSLIPSDITKLELNFPSIKKQKNIARLIQNINQKIELNRSINHNLEAMAKQLYDYWFLQFDFPDENGKPYKSSGGKMVWNEKLKREIPEGWELTKVVDIAKVFNGATPSTIREQNYGGDIIWITPKDLSDQKQKFVCRGERNISQIGYDSCSTHLLPVNTILMSSRAPIGLLAIAKTELCTNQGFKNFVLQKENMTNYLYYYLQIHIKQIEQLGTGTTFKEVSREDILKYLILKPNETILYLWEEKIKALNHRQFKLQEEIQQLIKLRDELLPLLMNGQIEIGVERSRQNCD